MSESQKCNGRFTESADQTLFAMLAHSNDYTPEAIDAAKTEIQRRNFSAEQISQLKAATRQSAVAEASRGDQSLSWSARALVLFLSVPTICVVPLIISERCRSRGYDKKASQCLIWTGIGWLFWGFAVLSTGPHGYGLLLLPFAFVVAVVADAVVHFRRRQ